MTRCLVYLPHSYTGRGPAESCVRIAEHFPACGIETTLFVHRARSAIAPSLNTVEAVGGPFRRLPLKVVQPVSTRRLAALFRRAVDAAGPGTIAWFWPNAPIDLVRHARSRGVICVREMINNPLARAKPILDEAYRSAGLPPAHGITETMVRAENAELALYDWVFSSNAEVDASLAALGVPEERILKVSFGWTQERLELTGAPAEPRQTIEFRAVFVGLMNVRKGIPTLLDAWERAGIDGELLLAGTVEPCLRSLVEAACARGRVRHVGRVDDVAALYRSCDVLVFPTHEEGGPQVTYEAAACNLPVITTPMGAARLINHERTGLIVEAGDAEALAQALRRLADDPSLRMRLSNAAHDAVGQFEYTLVAKSRAALLQSCAAR